MKTSRNYPRIFDDLAPLYSHHMRAEIKRHDLKIAIIDLHRVY